MAKKPNILFFGIDSLRRDRTSLYGYKKQTTPHIDKFFSEDSIVFDNMFSPHIPTTPGYSNMLSGLDCFGTNVVALRHKGDYAPGVKTLQEVLGENGYNTSCIGFNHMALCMDRMEQLEIEWIPFNTNVNLFVTGALPSTLAMEYNEYYQLLQAGMSIKEE